ncbi:hypothetical protein CB1_001890008 [Camelus ferus]|nr:hypothetical protein CB1_001890008 [Camelus ferus]
MPRNSPQDNEVAYLPSPPVISQANPDGRLDTPTQVSLAPSSDGIGQRRPGVAVSKAQPVCDAPCGGHTLYFIHSIDGHPPYREGPLDERTMVTAKAGKRLTSSTSQTRKVHLTAPGRAHPPLNQVGPHDVPAAQAGLARPPVALEPQVPGAASLGSRRLRRGASPCSQHPVARRR